MGKVFAEITMSLDGFVAGPGISNEQPMGIDGPKLHDWLFDKSTGADKQWVDELMQTSGAVITGNHTYSTAIDDAWGGKSPFIVPAFVLCHSAPSKKIKGFEYITGGMDEALNKAKKAANDKNVWIMGGANVIQQYIKAGDVDELRLHIAPILLMQGTRLFDNIGNEMMELIKEKVMETPGAIHTVFRLKG